MTASIYADGDGFYGPPLALSMPGGGRAYRHPETDELMPSVTTVIGILDKPGLVGWAARETAGAAWDQREALAHIADRDAAIDLLKNARYRSMDRARLRGSSVHRVAEALANDAPLPAFTDHEQRFLDAFVSFVTDFAPTFEIVEGTVFSDRWHYAGTFDFLAMIGGLLILGDHKTGKGIYPEVALQLAALRYADRVWDPITGALTPMPEVDGTIAVHLQADGYRVVEIDAGPDAFEAFCGLRAAWPWAHDGGGSAQAVGASLSPQRLVRTFAQKAVPAT